MKYFFITFGNNGYEKALKRITEQAKSFEIFDTIIKYTDQDLKKDTNFFSQYGPFIERNKRGYGYWIWKPYLAIKTFEMMNDGDILVYADAGCVLNIHGKPRLLEYFDLVQNSQFGVVSFQMNHQIEKKWTKGDVFGHFDAYRLANSGQLSASSFIIKKCAHAVNMTKIWFQTCCSYHLIDDSPSRIPNDPIFKEHRHDQSIWSIIRKKYGTEYLTDETYTYPDWNSDYPIWCMRSREA